MRQLLKINTIGLLLLFLLLSSCATKKETNPDNSLSPYFAERNLMVEQQIKQRGIKDQKILDAFLKVQRHRFIPENLIEHAYKDRPLPIGEGQTISQPYMVAFMTYILNLERDEKVLEIGTGSGYQAAVLGELCNNVFTIEIIESLGKKAGKLLKELGYTNVKTKIGDGYKGWKEYAPFDAIIVTCAPTHVPQPLKEQLAEGGRMIIPVGGSYVQQLVFLRKVDGILREEDVFQVRFVPMVDTTGTKY